MMDTATNPSTTVGTSEGSGGSGGVGGVTAVSTAMVVAEDASARAAHKRYEALVMVKNKAIKGKGASYWAHLEPVLIHSADTGLPKAVKLRCALCDSMFSASNPSRTASEHLKRGKCPNFSSPAAAAAANPSSTSSPSGPKPLASIPPCSSALPSHHHHPHHSSGGRKRSSPSVASPSSPYHVTPLPLLDPYSSSCTPTPPQFPAPPPPAPSQQLVLSGGKEDLGALAMLEDRVKKLKSPKASPGPALSKAQAESALSLLSDWIHECCGAVSFTALSHPKFLTFLNQVGLPSAGGGVGGVHPRDLAGPRLDARYREAQFHSDARLHDSAFFQLASRGWQQQSSDQSSLITLTANLPNGTTVVRKALFSSACAPSKYAQEILWDVAGVSSAGNLQRCAGIVADRFKSKALRDLEAQHQWLVNIPCQLQALRSLLKDFTRDLPVVISVATACSRITSFFNSNSRARAIFRKYQLQELDHSNLLFSATDAPDHDAIFAMLDDVMTNAHPLRLAVHDEFYKLLPLDEPSSREMADRVRDPRFWAELEAVHSLIKLLTSMATELELERPLVGQCLPLWEDLRAKLKEWCGKYNVDHMAVDKVIDRRFKKSYHPAWSAAFILDPLYLIKDSSGKYLPPFKLLSPEQEKDVDKLIMRLVSREEAHIALMELMKWRSEGLDPFYAQAVQMKEPDPISGKMRIANPQSSMLVWEKRLSEFKLLGKVAVRLIFLHATACGYKCNSALIRWATAVRGPSRAAAVEQAEKLVFVAAQAKLDRRDFSSEEEKDAELLAAVADDDDVLNEAAFVEASSV